MIKETWTCDSCGDVLSDVGDNPWKRLNVSIIRHNGKPIIDETVELCPTCQRKLLDGLRPVLERVARRRGDNSAGPNTP